MVIRRTKRCESKQQRGIQGFIEILTHFPRFKFLDEQIIRRRLQIDGEGVGDDRKINLLLKTFARYCNSTDEKEEAHIQTQLAQCEFSVLKSDLSEQMIDEELKNYKKVSDNIAERIEMVKEQIEQSKNLLVTAKEIRNNKLEYSSLARLIKKEPDRKEMVVKHESLKEELKKQETQFEKVQKSLENRRKSFRSFMMITRELMKDLKDSSFDISDSPNEIDADEGTLDDEDDEIGQMVIVEQMIVD